MKKSKKKLLGLGTSLLIGSACAIVGIGVLKVNKSESIVNQNNMSRSVQNDGFGLTEHDSFPISKSLISTHAEKETYVKTPNVTKPVPEGYIIINKKNQLICLNKNNPNKVLWYKNYDPTKNILAIEYTPYNDTLVVLYSKGNKTWSNISVYIDKYSGISKWRDGSEYSPDSPKLVTSYSYDNFPFREDTWALSPVYKKSEIDGDSAQVTSYIIYPKVHINTHASKLSVTFFEYSIINHDIQPKSVNYLTYPDQNQIIMGMGSWIYKNQIHVVTLVLRKNASGTKVQIDYLVKENNSDSYVLYGSKIATGISGNLLDLENDVLFEAAKSNISGTAFDYIFDTSIMTITFALNVWKSDNDSLPNSFHENTKLITVSAMCENKTFTHENPKVISLWEETWGGYFDSSLITAKGIGNNFSSPLVLEGYESSLSNRSMNYDGRFVAVISNVTSFDNGYHLMPSQNLNDERWRIYMQTNTQGVNKSNSIYYSNVGTSVDISSNNQLGLNQGAFGIPILEYNTKGNNISSDVFNLNIISLKNGSRDGIFINQKDRGPNTRNLATYGYYTHPYSTKTIWDKFGDGDIEVSSVDKEYLYRVLKIGNVYWADSEFLRIDLEMKNTRDDAKFLIKENTITYDYSKGSVSFDLYSTIVYTSIGVLNYNTIDDLESNWYDINKIGTFTLTGFKPIKTTTINDLKIDPNLEYHVNPPYNYVRYPGWLIPSEIATNQYNSRTDEYFKNFIWQSICNGGVFSNLKLTPSYNVQTWEQDFSNFFPNFKIKETNPRFDNETGSIILNVKVSTKYAVPKSSDNDNSLVSFNDWHVSGLRKVGATKFISNNESTAFINHGWKDKNIPYINSGGAYEQSIIWPKYVASDVQKIQESEIKQFLFDTCIKPAYDASNKENQFEASSEWVKNVAYKRNYGWQSDGKLEKLIKDNIIISGFEYFPSVGKMKLNVRLNVWNQNDQVLHWAQGVIVDGVQGNENVFSSNVPNGTWWIGGFRTDNVTTYVNTNDNWELEELSDIPVSDFDNSKYRDAVNIAIVKQGIKKQYLRFPYWVNVQAFEENKYKELISYDKLSIIDVAQGIARVRIKFKSNYWYARNDGTIAESSDERTTKDVVIKGFRVANPIVIDSSQFFNISSKLLISRIYLNPIKNSKDFVEWLKKTESNIIDYIVMQDKLVNPGGALPKEEWQQRLQFNYSIDNIDDVAFTFIADDTFNAINEKLATQNGKLGFMYSDVFSSGFKLWVKITDLKPDSPYTLEDKTTNPDKGFGLKGLLDTQNIILHLNMNDWIENLKKYRGTTVQGLNVQNSTIESIKPPLLLNNSAYGFNMEFNQIEFYLKQIGYKFIFSWKDSNGNQQQLDTLPTNFSYDSENPIINVTISNKDLYTFPRIYIFNDDNLHLENSVSINLSLAVKKTLKIDYSFFKEMYKHLNIDMSNKNITINSIGSGDSSTISAIKTSWSQFEEKYWELNNSANKDEYKQKLKIVYSIDGSNFTLDLNSMWNEINKSWAEAIKDITKIGKLRFYSPTFNDYGIKIQVKVVFQDDVNLDEYAIEYKEGKSQVIVNHKLSTTFDMSEYSNFWSTIKSKTDEGSTFENLKGFTPATFNNVTFDQFEKETKKQLGLLIQYSNNNKDWFDSRNLITSVNKFDPAVYMRFSSKIDDYNDWGNNFEIKNFSIGVTNTTNESSKWSSGVKLPLNLSRYLQVNQSWVDEFINSKPLSGNTKYLNINEDSEYQLISKIVNDNQPIVGTQPPKVWLEYRLGQDGEWNNRETFIENLKSSIEDATTNFIQFRINVDPIDVNDPIYAVQDVVYDLHKENIGKDAIIKIFVNESYENQAINVAISGTNDSFKYEYNGLPVNENGEWIGANGLMIQWTIDKSANYQDVSNDSKWKNIQIDSIDPVARYLAIRIIAKDGYVYGASYTGNNHNPDPHANIHIVNANGIKSKIEVDLNILKTLNLSGYVHKLNIEQLIKNEEQILNNIHGGNNLKIHYQVVLANGNKLNSDWKNANELKLLLNEYSKNYEDDNQGLIKFKVNNVTSSISTALVKATFVSINDQFLPIDKNNANLDQGVETNTDEVKTIVNLSTWYEALRTIPTSFKSGSTSNNIQGITPPGMDGAFGSGFLAGMSYLQIITLLKTIGLEAQFKAPDSSTGDKWVSLNEINDLNNANELYIRFKVINEFQNSVEVLVEDNVIQDNLNPREVKLVINLPITLIVSTTELKKLQFVGHTANLQNFNELEIKEKEIIQKIIQDSQTSDITTNDKIKFAKLSIKYLLNGNPGEKTWMTLGEVKNYLTNSRVNFNSNEVKAKVFILDNPQIDDYGTPQFQLSSDEEVVIQPKQFDDEVKFKVYIYQTEPTNPVWIFNNKYLEGSEKQYTIKDLDLWQKEINDLKGLELEFNSISKDGQPQNDSWSKEYNANNINKNKDYWIRFKVKPGFVFQNALQNDNQHSNPIKLDASRIKVTISLQSKWLEKLVLTGNTKNLNIDENNVVALVNNELPDIPNREKLIKIEYTINEQKWFTKDEFVNQLVILDGGLSEIKWIILREDIKARFVIDNEINNQFNPSYGLEIDGFIVNNESKSPIVQLINDEKQINSDVKGYINTNKLTPFIASNFFVTGTNTNAFLITKEVAKFNKMLDGYKSTRIFDVLYSSEENKFIEENKVWNPEGNGIVEKLALKGDFASKYIAINLKANSDKYDVYHNNEKQADGYIISSPDIKVSLSIEIINPLIDKKISITYINNQKQAIFYQNEGSFLFNIEMGNGKQMNFDDFINQLPEGNNTEIGQYTQDMKNAMELAYYVSDHFLTNEEYNEIIKPSNIQKTYSISNEKYGVWKSAPLLNNNTNLNLSVNDYIIVALRIKPEFLSNPSKDDSGFVIKNNEHTPTLQSRAYGYKVKTSEIQVNWNSIEVKNVEAPVNIDKGLDGFAVLNKLSLVEDAGKNYQGVSLKLNYFNEFYRDVNNKVLVSNTGDRLVKRVEVGDGIYRGEKPYYGAGGQPIRDDKNKEIYPYYDSKNRPSKPIKQPTSTRNLNLSEKEDNVFSFYNKDGNIEGINNNLIEYSLFANQDIEIEFMNKKGLSTEEGVYDYYVDQTNVTRTYTLPTSLIKFLVSNVNNIRYEFNSKEFKQTIADPNPSNVFVNNKDETKLPKNGESKIKDNIMYKVTKTETNKPNVELKTIEQIKEQINKDFNSQVKLQTSIRRKGSSWEPTKDYGLIQDYTNLENGDFIKVEIVPTDDDFVYAQQPEPLTFQITTLTIEDAPINLFQWLRVEQVGDWDGEGSFRIYVDDPNNPNDDNLTIEDLSSGKYYFEVQVWGVDPTTNERVIKHKWTRDIDTINDLKNGDKVAWQLRSPEGTVSSAYFNTVADIANHNSSENKYSFVQINKKGLINVTPPVSQPENGPIGPKPSDEDAYPETSGFEIANLRIRDQDQEFTSISYSTFADLMKEMNFSYQGVNGNGNMISSKDPRNVIVDIEKPSSQFRAKRATTFTLQYLIDKGYLSFAYNTVGLSDFNRFSWNQVKDPSGNYLVAPGLLSNGDKVKAIYKDPTMSTAYEVQLNDVWGLSKKTDSMSMFAWVGIGVASVATLGIFAFIYFFARNRKLKVK